MDQEHSANTWNDPYQTQQRYEQPKTNGKAIAALVLGILSVLIPYLGFFIGVVAIILAALSFKEIKRNGENGHGLAVAGLVCGIIGTVLYGILLLLVVLAFAAFAVY